MEIIIKYRPKPVPNIQYILMNNKKMGFIDRYQIDNKKNHTYKQHLPNYIIKKVK